MIHTWQTLGASEVTITGSGAVVNGLTIGTHKFRVQAVRSRTGTSELVSGWTEVSVTLSAPPVPTIQTHESVAHGQIRLEWAPVAGATGYDVAQKKPLKFRLDQWPILPSGDLPGITVTITVTPSKVTAVIGGLAPGKEFSHKIRSRNVQGASEWSSEKSTTALDERPEKPTGLRSQFVPGGRGIGLLWTAAARATSYDVIVLDRNPSTAADFSGTAATIIGLTPDKRYTIKVVARNRFGAGPESDAIRLRAPKVEQFGHQADHVVKFMTGTISNSIIENAIADAVANWNKAIGALGKDLEICESCGAKNADTFTVTIKTVADSQGCDTSFACVDPGASGIGSDGHLGNLTMIFEDPPWTGSQGAGTLWQWTDDPSNQEGHKVPNTGTGSNNPPRLWADVDRIMLHEFGHTLGLHDFYNDPYMENQPRFKDAVMHTGATITLEDLAQLKAIYLLHTRH